MEKITINGSLSGQGQINGTLSGVGGIGGTMTVPERITIEYDGPYSFTPTAEAQTISIKNKTATDDIIINPVPSNYGLITWNGSTLMVS